MMTQTQYLNVSFSQLINVVKSITPNKQHYNDCIVIILPHWDKSFELEKTDVVRAAIRILERKKCGNWVSIYTMTGKLIY